MRNPFGVQYSSFESRSASPKELATDLQTCELLFQKRFYNILYFLPINTYSNEEKEKLNSVKSVRFKNIFRLRDIFHTAILGVFLSFTSYTTEIESCSKEKPKTAKSNAKDFKEEYVEIPILARFTNYRENSNLNGAKQFYFLFESKKATLQKEEEKKLDSFLETYKSNYSNFKLFLLLESDEDFKINGERISKFKNILSSKGISSSKIYSAVSNQLNITSKDNQLKNRINIFLLD